MLDIGKAILFHINMGVDGECRNGTITMAARVKGRMSKIYSNAVKVYLWSNNATYVIFCKVMRLCNSVECYFVF